MPPRRTSLQVVGLHVHVGSQITTPEPIRTGGRASSPISRSASSPTASPSSTSISAAASASRTSPVRPSSRSRTTPTRSSGDPPTPDSLLVLEPGRWIVGPAGVLVTEVVDLKRRPDGGWFVIVDAGMTDLLRPALYGAWHDIEPVRAARRRRPPRRRRRPRVRDERHARTRSHAAARRGRRSAGDSRHRRLRRGHGVELQSASDRGRGAGRWTTPGASSAGARRSTTCCSGTSDAHRVRRSRSKRQGNAGAHACARASSRTGSRCARCRFPTTARRSAARSRQALAGEREFTPDVMQLLYVANRYEYRPRLELWLGAGDIVICDRYRASSVAYGEAQGLDAAGSTTCSATCPSPSLTMLLDIAPETAVRRKQTGRDRYERDLGAARARPRELPPTGHPATLGRHRRRAVEGSKWLRRSSSAVLPRLARPSTRARS